MTASDKNIFPVFDELLSKKDKENLLNQHAFTIWLTGLSGSGKTTIAKGVEKTLHDKGYLCKVLDGDNLRSGLCNNLSFTENDRLENIRRVAEISKLFNDGGILTINCFVSPSKNIRALAQDIIGKEAFHEVYIKANVELCEQRDVKGLYKKARAGEIKNFTGIDAPFEIPNQPSLVIDTKELSVDESIEKIINYFLPKIEIN